MTLLDAFIFCAAIVVLMTLIMWFAPLPEHPITKARKRNEEIARLTDALAASEAQNKELREALQQIAYPIENDNLGYVIARQFLENTK
jgi:putative hemolysin